MALLSQSFLLRPRLLPFFPVKCLTPLVQPLVHTTHTEGHDLSICHAFSEASHSIPDLVELPIYPLPVVLFPGAVLPLQLSEFRYRIMMHTLLQTDLKFGVLFSNPMLSGTEHYSHQVGCVAEVVKHHRLLDGRFSIICKGLERFCIARIQRTKPYMVATVTWLEDRPPGPAQGDNLENLASEVEGYMKDVTRLANRLEGNNQDNQNNDIEFRRGQLPTPFSFFVASNFEGAPSEQQELLEMDDTAARLEREIEMLKININYIIAALAVKDAFSSSP